MRFRVLGPLRIHDDTGRDVTPSGTRQRRLLAALLLEHDAIVSTDRLLYVVWGDEQPVDGAAALQTQVFRLRKALPTGAIETAGNGYRLHTVGHEVDAQRFVDAVGDASVSRGTNPQRALGLLDEALSWWRGEPYEDLIDHDRAVVEAERLAEMRAVAREERLATLIDLGKVADALPDLVALVAEQPLREQPRALLMTALHLSGRSTEASRHFDDFARVLASEVGLEPSAGLRRLHDRIVLGESLAPTAAVEQVPSEPPGAIRSAAPSTIPTASSSLIGRDELIGAITDELAEHRLVTLVGTGGVGKTRIAAEVARRVRDGGAAVWFCELAPVDAASVEVIIADALGVEERVGAALVARIAEALRGNCMLVLDNCEHVIDRAAAVAEAVLRAAPDCRVLATSRERLAVDGERLRPIAPFPLAEVPRSDEAAIRLFAERAAAVRPGFELTDDGLPLVAQICRRLDGLPLAIELAAARLHAMDLGDVAAGLDHRFRLLTSGARTSTRQRSLAAAVAWSYDLLDPGLRAAFDGLGVFAGPFDAAAAAEVLALERLDTTEVLIGLVERSLLQRTGDGRFALLETLKQFAAERLEATNRLHDMRRRHAAWALARVQTNVDALATANDDAPMRALDMILADLRAAHRFLVEIGDADMDLRFIVALNDYGFFRSRLEVLAWAEDAARLGRAIGHPLTPAALGVASLAAWKRGDIEQSIRAAAEGDALTTELGVPESSLVGLMNGVGGLATGNLDDARAWFERSQATGDARTVETTRVIAVTTWVLASAFDSHPGVQARADELLESLQPGPTVPGSYAWYAAAEAVATTDPALAMERARRALADAQTTGCWFVRGVSGAFLASVGGRLGDVDDAVAVYRWLLPMWRRSGEWTVLSTVLRSAAALLARLGADESAATVLGTVLGTTIGHEVFGDDAQRLAALGDELRERLGDETFEGLIATGGQLDVDSAAALAAAELDRLVP